MLLRNPAGRFECTVGGRCRRDEPAALERIRACGRVRRAIGYRRTGRVPSRERLIEPRGLRRGAVTEQKDERPGDGEAFHLVPIARSSRSVRKYHFRSTSAGDASTCALSLLTWSRSNVAPARSTKVSPSSFVKNTLLSTPTGDAEKPSRVATPRRPWNSTSPVAALSAVAMLVMSFTRYRKSP